MSLFSTFHNDPFFSGVHLPRATALEHRSRHDNRDRQITTRHENDDRSFDLFSNPFAFMQNMTNNMGQMETRMINNGHGVSFSSSTVISMDKRNDGQPRIVQATSEKLRGPEGLERTRKAVRDTGRNLEKMEIAHRLGERGHRITKERDPTSGQLLENREFDHIEDEHEFEREWFNRAEKVGLKNSNGNGFSSHTNNLLMTPPSFGRLRSQSQEPRHLAIDQTPPNSSHSRHQEQRKN